MCFIGCKRKKGRNNERNKERKEGRKEGIKKEKRKSSPPFLQRFYLFKFPLKYFLRFTIFCLPPPLKNKLKNRLISKCPLDLFDLTMCTSPSLPGSSAICQYDYLPSQLIVFNDICQLFFLPVLLSNT